MKKHIISILLSLLLVSSTLLIGAVPAFAAEGDITRKTVTYFDENGISQTAENCIRMGSSEAVENYSFEAGEWYVVEGTFTVNNRVENLAPADDPAHLILGFGCAFYAEKGIHNPEGKGLVIYTHSKTAEGSLTATASGDKNADAAIGGNAAETKQSGDLTINGGVITATGGIYGGAGIGGGFQNGGGNVVINGGTVTAEGGYNGGAGIGGGLASDINIGEITVNGGTVTATGGSYGAAGIGGGKDGGFKKITVNGGTVTATGGSYGGAGIGKSFTDVDGDKNGDILITGGKVTAIGGKDSAGIGGGNNYPDLPGLKVDTITITGGEITAEGNNTAAIGGGRYCKDHGEAIFGEDLEILAGSTEQDAYYHNHELYLLKRAPYAYVHAIPAYTVKHLTQKADGTGYETAETETLRGYTGELTRAAFKEYDGFVPQSFAQQTIKKDGSTVVEISYNKIIVPDPVHEHTFSTEWSANASNHWHASDCSHSVVAELGEHTFGAGVKNGGTTAYTCTVCGYVKTETEDVTAQLLTEALAAKAELEKQLEAKQAELTKLDEESKAEIETLNAEIDSLNARLEAANREIERLKTQSGDPGAGEDNTCSKCGKIHADDFFGKITCFFNRLANFFKNMFK